MNTESLPHTRRAKINLAAHIVGNPQDFTRVPSVITDSWAQMKEAQGHPISLDRMNRISARHNPLQSSLARDIAERAPRISAYIAQRLAEART